VSDDDAALLRRARDGDLDAFSDFVRLHERRVRGVLARLLADRRDVEEATQDTFVQAWRSLERYRGDAAPFTWLYRIAVNEAMQRMRRRQLELRPIDDAAAPASAPAEESELREQSAFLLARLRALPPDLRVAVVLRDVEGLSNSEVASALSLSVPAAKSRIHRGRMQLRAEYADWLRTRR